jgi:hypothetical protein
VPNNKDSLVKVKTSVKLKDTKKEGKEGNKTQAVTLLLVKELPKELYYL